MAMAQWPLEHLDDIHAASCAMHWDTIHTAHSTALIAGPIDGDWAGGPLQPTGDFTCRDVQRNNDQACTDTTTIHLVRLPQGHTSAL